MGRFKDSLFLIVVGGFFGFVLFSQIWFWFPFWLLVVGVVGLFLILVVWYVNRDKK